MRLKELGASVALAAMALTAFGAAGVAHAASNEILDSAGNSALKAMIGTNQGNTSIPYDPSDPRYQKAVDAGAEPGAQEWDVIRFWYSAFNEGESVQSNVTFSDGTDAKLTCEDDQTNGVVNGQINIPTYTDAVSDSMTNNNAYTGISPFYCYTDYVLTQADIDAGHVTRTLIVTSDTNTATATYTADLTSSKFIWGDVPNDAAFALNSVQPLYLYWPRSLNDTKAIVDIPLFKTSPSEWQSENTHSTSLDAFIGGFNVDGTFSPLVKRCDVFRYPKEGERILVSDLRSLDVPFDIGNGLKARKSAGGLEVYKDPTEDTVSGVDSMFFCRMFSEDGNSIFSSIKVTWDGPDVEGVVESPEVTPTPTPTPTPNETPSDDPTPQNTPTSEPTESTEPVVEPSETPAATLTETPAPQPSQGTGSKPGLPRAGGNGSETASIALGALFGVASIGLGVRAFVKRK